MFCVCALDILLYLKQASKQEEDKREIDVNRKAPPQIAIFKARLLISHTIFILFLLSILDFSLWMFLLKSKTIPHTILVQFSRYSVKKTVLCRQPLEKFFHSFIFFYKLCLQLCFLFLFSLKIKTIRLNAFSSKGAAPWLQPFNITQLQNGNENMKKFNKNKTFLGNSSKKYYYYYY